ncbi:MAG TPA: phosphoadenylyl-sulfate reductase [Blastocatellia bacterium]|nr:phosphoadenylyl-sulfate reductase [Blastocatellia bacterium]
MTMALIETVRLGPTRQLLTRLADAAALLEDGEPEQALQWAFEEFESSVSIATGFGAEGVALIDMAVKLNPQIDIFFLDTSFLFPETHELRRRLEDRYRITIRSHEPDLTPEQQEAAFGPKLWSKDPDLCCRLRKLEPLRKALQDRRAWITAIRRDQTLERSAAHVVEWDYQWQLVKINPIARWSRDQVWEYISRNDVPYNPLHDRGYPSIGCTHCTAPVRAGEDERSGRWSGYAKKECGLHIPTRQTVVAGRDADLSGD